jgi:hypothetical protein
VRDLKLPVRVIAARIECCGDNGGAVVVDVNPVSVS